MRKYGKWVLTLGLLATTPVVTFAAEPGSTDYGPSNAVRASKIDNQRMADNIAAAMNGQVSGEINIEYRDGVAVLTGSVSDAGTKSRAKALAERVPNVTRVDNRLVVAEKRRSLMDRSRKASSGVVQAGLEGDVSSRDAIQQTSATVPPPGVQPSAFKGAGAPYQVPVAQAAMPAAPQQQAFAYPTAQGQPVAVPAQPAAAVQQPAAQAHRTAQAPSANQEVAEQIGAVLSTARLDGYNIEIRFQNGIATLEGSVGTQAERAAAYQAVSSVQGVKSVNNRLTCTDEPVARPATPPMAQNRQAQYQAQYQAQPGWPRGEVRGAAYQQPAPGQPGPMPAQGGAVPMSPGGPPAPPAYGYQGGGASQAVYNSPSMPDHAWPTYAQYPNSAAVTYPQQYSASAWPYIGPFYPYPQVPLGWRDATLRWDDGQWNLMFKPRTDRWWWFMNPNNW